MYPFHAVIVGGSEAEMTTMRREVTNLGVTVEHEFADIDQAMSQRPILSASKCFFFIKVNSKANMDQLSRLNQLFLGKPIVALLNEDSDVSAVLNIQRAGAAQVLRLPFRPTEVRAALDTVARQFGCPTTSSKVIAVLGASEGCGSTCLAINLSDAFANAQSQNCILLELSLRLGRIAFYLNIEPTVNAPDLLAGNNTVEVNAVNLALVRVMDRFHVVAGPHRAVDRRSILPGKVLPLIGCLRQIAEVVVLDMPYTLDDLYFEALSVADQVVLVARPSPPSIQALQLVSEAVAQRALGATQHFVINCYGPRAEEFTEDQLCKALAAERIWTIANDPDGFEAAVNNGRPLHQERPKSPAWPAIKALADRLTGLDEPHSRNHAPGWPTWVADLFRGAPKMCDPPLTTS